MANFITQRVIDVKHLTLIPYRNNGCKQKNFPDQSTTINGLLWL